ncbi:MAG: tetratricopeptide repeat protein, partial [Bacteroidota bacterium]
AIVHTEEALNIRLQFEDEAPEPVLLSAFNLGIYYNRAGQYQEAVDHYDMVLRRGPNRKQGVAYFQLGRCYRQLGEYEAAALAFKEAEKYSPFLENGPAKAELARIHGASLLEQEEERRLEQAIKQLEHAEELAVQYSGLKTVLDIRNDLGLGLIKLGRYNEAIALLTSNIADNNRLQISSEFEASGAAHLGLAYRRTGNLEAAKKQYKRSLALELSIADGYHPDEYVAVDYDNLSTLYLVAQQPDSALHYASLALDWHLDDYDPTDRNELPPLSLLAQGDQLPTLTYLMDKGQAHQALAQSGEQEHFEHALATYRRADELLDLLRQNQLLENTRTYWRADARQLYELAMDAAVAAGDPVSAFYFLEKA